MVAVDRRGSPAHDCLKLNRKIPSIGVDRPLPDDPEFLDFRFKPFSEMTEDDYYRLGFRSGLEVHQQLLTSKKLFCHCPAGRYSERYHAEILRHMRPTLSELGEYDGTALMEFKTRKDIIYHINRETVCTYEMDDTPPFHLNQEALNISLQIALLYRCALVDEIHIARKQYLDGSIPTGFQRTTIVGVDGAFPYKDRNIDIVQLALEEDSCREVSDVGHRRIYLTDRLGMPLIETVTAPQMLTPQEVAEVGEIIRRLSRSTGKVRTGIGAARQDVNVSIHGGTRIEIKGVPKLSLVPLLTYNEAMRQFNLLRLRAELKRRGITQDTFKARCDDVTRILRKSRFHPIREASTTGKFVKCVTLVGFGKLLHWPTQTDAYFGGEIADRVQVIACLSDLPNLIHSDSHTDLLAASEWSAVRKAVGATDEDTLVLVWGSQKDVETAAREIEIRAREATIGVPSETRQAFADGTNGFERILPGPNRMYPDTDLPPHKVTDETIAGLKASLPEYYWEREEWYKSIGVPADCIRLLAISPYAKLFQKAVSEWGFDPKRAAVFLIQIPKALKRKNYSVERLSAEILEKVFNDVRDGRITREAFPDVLIYTSLSGTYDGQSLATPASQMEIEEYVRKGCSLARSINGSREVRKRAAMGFIMKELLGRIEGEQVSRLVEAKLDEV